MSDEETRMQSRKVRRERWTKGLIIAAIGTAAAVLMALQPMASVISIGAQHIPVIANHEQRITSLEQQSLTNGIMLNNRFDRIEYLLTHRQNIAGEGVAAGFSTNYTN